MTPAEIEHQFPAWHVWVGVGGLWYARLPKSSPPIVCRNEHPVGLYCEVAYMEAWLAPRRPV
jgi:hypothetical protein